MGPLLARGLSQDFVPLKSRCIKGLADWILTSPCQRNIIVLAGAGASTAAGIPDFRSPGTGLYDNLQKYNLPTPESIFSLDYFRKAPDAFYELARDLWPGVQGGRPKAPGSPPLCGEKNRLPTLRIFVHIARLQAHPHASLHLDAGQEGPSLAVLHAEHRRPRAPCWGAVRACGRGAWHLGDAPGVSRVRSPFCFEWASALGFRAREHFPSGSFDTATCVRNGKSVPAEELRQAVLSGKEGPGGWQSLREKYGGLVKPDIVFFGENLPASFFKHRTLDFCKCQLLLVIGLHLS